MKMKITPLPPQNSRYGFCYFPDTEHYRECDLYTWLPELKAMGASWITLETPTDRAIPEYFLRGLLENGIEPILHIRVPVEPPPPLQDLRLLFQTYAKWGVHYISVFDRPNQRTSWPSRGWAQNNLVERFLDIYLPIADAAHQAELISVFPPLEPGGDYWDTAFLRAALQGIQRRGLTHLLENMVLGVYAWTWGRSLNWGSGGPERWPAARPYFTPPNSEDQMGFRIFDWYLAVARAVLEKPCKILIIAGGALLGQKPWFNLPTCDSKTHAEINIDIASQMRGEPDKRQPSVIEDPIPAEVLACNFWLLASSQSSPFAPQGWIDQDGRKSLAADAFRQKLLQKARSDDSASPTHPSPRKASQDPAAGHTKPLNHYLLLPVYEWGISDWHLEVIQPFVKKHHPIIGFSKEEAKYAAQVTVVGGTQSFSEQVLEELRQSGCTVRQIIGDGTNIASQLATL
jgi:hypothetical protein